MNYTKLEWSSFAIFLVFLTIAAYFLFFNDTRFSPEESEFHLECVDNACTVIRGPGFNECSSQGSFCGCLDTDVSEEFPEGENHLTIGTVRNSEISKTDSCWGNTLFEYVCDFNEVSMKEINCALTPGFTCQKGRCLPKEEAYKECIDSDDGSNYFETGKATQSDRIVQDYCHDEKILGEIICNEEENTILVELVDCSSLGSYKCQGGSCIPA